MSQREVIRQDVERRGYHRPNLAALRSTVWGAREASSTLLTVRVQSFGRLLDVLPTSALKRLGHRRRLIASDVGWRRDPALVGGGQLQQPPLDEWISFLGQGPDCPCSFPAKLVVHIRPRNSCTWAKA
jgi:hypothetical protein